MSSWPIRPQALLRVTLAFVTTVFPLLAIAMGGMDLLTWVHIHRGNQYYYVEYWSLVHARWFLLVGMIGVLPPPGESSSSDRLACGGYGSQRSSRCS